MCNVSAYTEYVDRLEDYLGFVNTDVDRLMAYEPEFYAAYGTHNELKVEEIKDWYQDAEEKYVTMYEPYLYLQKKYDVWRDEDIDYFYEKEVHKDGVLYECGDYWFTTE